MNAILAALALQQQPIPPGGLGGSELQIGQDVLQCIERHRPAVEEVARRTAPHRLEQIGATTPELRAILTSVDECLAALPSAGVPAAFFARLYLVGKSTILALARRLAAGGITVEALGRIAASRELRWLTFDPGDTIATPAQLDDVFGRFHVPRDLRRSALNYLVRERFLSMTEVMMRPPQRRATYLNGVIEANDFPYEARADRLQGTAAILFHVLPDGSIGVAWSFAPPAVRLSARHHAARSHVATASSRRGILRGARWWMW